MTSQAPTKLNFGLFGYRFRVKDGMITYRSAYGASFMVRLKDIETVSVDESGRGKGRLKLIGRGTTLADVTLPKQWAEKAQMFILNNID